MIDAKEANTLAESGRVKVSSSCDAALDKAVLEAITQGKKKVQIALGSKDCKESDEHVSAYLKQLGYTEVKVTSDYPGYNESYEGKTFITFRF